MEFQMGDFNGAAQRCEEDISMDVRKGPWTVEEDSLLVNYITIHGEGRWNSLARCAGLKRTGKSCRFRWLNYLRPDVRRGSITLQEQLLILELHSRWGNRWSKISQHLPGRTDNEIKNYWRTRVQKQAKQLKCDVNSKQFRDTMRFVWIPRLVERIQAASNHPIRQIDIPTTQVLEVNHEFMSQQIGPNTVPEISGASSDMSGGQVSPVSDLTDYYNQKCDNCLDSVTKGLDFHGFEQSNGWLGGEDSLESLWNDENFLFLQEQFRDEVL